LKTTAISGELREHRAIIARLREALAKGDLTMMVLFPTLSLLREIEAELLREPEIKGIGGVRFLLFEGFVGEVTESMGLKCCKPSQLQQELLISAAFRTLEQGGRLSYLERVKFTASYRRALLDGIAEWKRAGLSTELLVKWAVDQGEKEQQLAMLYFTYQHLLAAHGFVEEDGLLEQLRQIRVRTAPVACRPRVLLYGYTDLTPQQADFIDVLTLWYDFEVLLDPTMVPDLQELIRQHFSFKKPENAPPQIPAATALDQLRQSFGQSNAPVIPLAETDASVQLIQADGWARQATALAREIVSLLRLGAGYQLADFLILSPQPQEFLKTAQTIFAEYQLTLPQSSRKVGEFPAVRQFCQALKAAATGWQWPDLETLIRQFYADVDPQSRDKLLLNLGKNHGALSGEGRWLKLTADPQFIFSLKEAGIAPEPLQQCLEFLSSFPERAPQERYLQLTSDWFATAATLSLQNLTPETTFFQKQLQNYQAAQRLQEDCQEMLRNKAIWTELTAENNLEEFARFFADYLLQGEITPSEARPGIRVIRPQEARGLRAKVVLITGLEQGVFPRTYINDWKLSPASRFELKALGVELETGEQYQEQERLTFYWALQIPLERLYLVTRKQDDAGQPLNPSPFLTAVIQQIPALAARGRSYPLEPQVQPDFRQCLAPGEQRRRWADYLLQDPAVIAESERQVCDYLWQTPYYGRLAAKIAQWRGRPELTPERPLSGHPRVRTLISARFGAEHSFSVTELDEYRNCPLSFFFKRLLSVTAPAEPDLLPKTLDLGNLYHQILREFGEQHRGRVLRQEDQAEYAAGLEQSFECIFSDWQQKAANDQIRAMLAIQERQIRRTLRRWLAAELQWIRQTGYRYTPYLLEYSFGRPPGSADPASTRQPLVLHTEEGPIRLNGRIDRVDRETDGHLVVYDYKLGRGHNSASILEFKSLQIPVYLEALEQLLPEAAEAVGGCYLSLKEPSRTSGGIWRQAKTGLDGRSKGLLKETQWVDWLERMELEVAATVAGIRGGYFYLSDAKCPSYCQYRGACRRGEREEGRANGVSAE
jgi:ATP-dependent helicase/DNAse subunit B